MACNSLTTRLLLKRPGTAEAARTGRSRHAACGAKLMGLCCEGGAGRVSREPRAPCKVPWAPWRVDARSCALQQGDDCLKRCVACCPPGCCCGMHAPACRAACTWVGCVVMQGSKAAAPAVIGCKRRHRHRVMAAGDAKSKLQQQKTKSEWLTRPHLLGALDVRRCVASNSLDYTCYEANQHSTLMSGIAIRTGATRVARAYVHKGCGSCTGRLLPCRKGRDGHRKSELQRLRGVVFCIAACSRRLDNLWCCGCHAW